ncbi:MAG TPA: hypothetical protein VK550_35280 [Polyangiaceae bacterium]|jgi:hypothetical protein|nr:hypothetical protein [Polyangiaceae bacterium]
MGKNVERTTFGFSVHTGWAALIAVAGSPASPLILDRSRIEMIPDSERDPPRFVYHAAQELALGAAERVVRVATEQSRARALSALKAAVAELGKRGHEVVASGILVSGRPPDADLATILKSHALLHAAEGELFRQAIKSASEKLKIPVTEVRARELPSRAAGVLKVSAAELPDRLAKIGRSAGRPWSKDQKDGFLVALLAASA